MTTFRSLVIVGAAATLTASASQAAVLVSTTQEPTPNLTGYTTYTVILTTDAAGSAITSLDLDFDGPMNQVNPAGSATIFNDNNAFFAFVGADVRQDSQFLFNSGSVLEVNTSESANNLTAAFTSFTPFVSQAVAQLAIPGSVAFDFEVVVDPNISNGITTDRFVVPLTGNIPIPEPASVALLGLGGLLIARRRK